MSAKKPKFVPPSDLTSKKEETPKATSHEILYPVTSLPSGFKAYPKDCTIEYRPYTFGEMLKIGQLQPLGLECIRLVLEGVVTSFDSLDLTFFDYQFIALKRKLITLGDLKTQVRFKCRFCETLNTYILGVDELGDFEDIEAPELPVFCKLNTEAVELEWIPITVGRYLDLLNAGKVGDRLALYAASVKNLSFEEAFEFLGRLVDESDIEVLKRVDRYLGHGMKPFSRKCTKCEKEVSVRLEAGEAMLLPFRKSEESVETRIYFGSKTTSESK